MQTLLWVVIIIKGCNSHRRGVDQTLMPFFYLLSLLHNKLHFSTKKKTNDSFKQLRILKRGHLHQVTNEWKLIETLIKPREIEKIMSRRVASPLLF